MFKNFLKLLPYIVYLNQKLSIFISEISNLAFKVDFEDVVVQRISPKISHTEKSSSIQSSKRYKAKSTL